MDRQQRLWKLLDRYLDPEDNARIVGILTVTPLEHKMLFEDETEM